MKKKAQPPNVRYNCANIDHNVWRYTQRTVGVGKRTANAEGQVKLHAETSKKCIFTMIGGKITRHYEYKTGFYTLPDMPPTIPENNDRVLGMITLDWQDNILLVIR